MVDNNKMLLVICLVALIGGGIPAMLWAGMRGRNSSIRQFDLLRRAGKTAANPWGKENADLAELSKQVEKLKQKPKL